jgi:iron complex transport system ATP-binding protein
MLVAREVTIRYPGSARAALDRVSLEVRLRELVAVVGPNGSGKTTLMRALLGMIPLTGGSVELEGRSIAAWRSVDRARRVGFVPQQEDYPFAWRVDEMVGFGRYAWLPSLGTLTARDREVVARAMARADVTQLAARRIDTLSGGEWQRVRIARALAQESRLLLLDEPTAALDFGHEMEVFELVRELVAEGLAAVVVTHQLNLAARFADRIQLLDQGQEAAQGSAREVLEPALLARVFGWPVAVDREVDGVPQFHPLRRPRLE